MVDLCGDSSPNPSAQQIVDQLAPTVDELGTGARTRSLRNLAPVARAIDMNVQFEFASATLTSDGESSLQQLAIALKSVQLSGLSFVVEGHTDAKGSSDYNFSLSLRRANAVVLYLQSKGIEPDRLRSVGKGFSELMTPEDPFSPVNRRVRIVTSSTP